MPNRIKNSNNGIKRNHGIYFIVHIMIGGHFLSIKIVVHMVVHIKYNKKIIKYLLMIKYLLKCWDKMQYLYVNHGDGIYRKELIISI